MTSSSIYDNNIYNKNFHDINYYKTLEMQPIPVKKFNKTINQPTPPIPNNDNGTNEDIVSEVSEDVSTNDDKPTIETINKNEEIVTA